MKYTISFICLLLCFSICKSQRLKTPTLSPFSEISQEIGLTKISLKYSRPSAKGRKVFGNLVPYNTIWRTGANASTKITFTESAKIGGQTILPGTYAIYTIPSEDLWTIIIHSNTTLRSIAGDAYKSADDIFRFEVKPIKTTNYVESFTMQFATLTSDSLELQLVWENTLISIPMKLEVASQIEQQMTEFMKTPESIPHRTYFEAAQYYSNNGKDLNEALDFIDKALEKSPENFRYGLLKAKIQAKNNNGKGALITVKIANQWEKKKKNDNYIEQ
ncbi:MAG: DUF2911 domain-containing protein, partial [Flavobacteriaceae bacterium]|nr:DUF2911 domain-containing protein [Flavobacteriaceae bacterium]